MNTILKVTLGLLVVTQLASCKLLKNAKATEAFAQAKKDDPDYVAEEGGREREAKLEKEWPKLNEYKVGTVGYNLQGHFRAHCAACTEKKVYDSLDYVPGKFRNIRNDFLLSTKVQTIKASIGNLFFYTFSTSEKNEVFGKLTDELLKNNQIISPSKVIGLNDANFNFSTATFQTAPGYAGFLLKQSCSGYMDAALNANITPPFSAIKASLKTDFEKKSSILLVDGYFKSPLSEILDKRDNKSINTYFYLWKTYQSNKDLIDNAWYLDVFRGLMATRLVNENSNFDVEGSLNAAYKNALIDVNGKFEAGFKLNKEFNLQDWETYIYLKDNLDAEEKKFLPLPNPDKIIEAIYELDKTPSDSRSQLHPFSKNIPHTHTIRLIGVPSEFCNQKWKLNLKAADVYKPNSQSIISSYKFENEQDICECQITGTPQDKWFTSDKPVNTVNVEYELVNTEKVDNKELKVEIKRNISTTGEPRFEIVGGVPERSKISVGENDSEYYLRWTYDLILQDRNNIIIKESDNTGITTPEIIDLSKSGLNYKLIPNVIYNPNDKSRYQLIIKTNIPIKEIENGKIKEYSNAFYNIPLTARIKTGGEVNLVINNVSIPLPIFESTEPIKK